MGKILVLDPAGIEELLSHSLVGRIACAAPEINNGRPTIVPLAYGYDGEAAYAVGPVGQKIRIMRIQPLISFEVDEAEAEDRWRSAVAEGVYEELSLPGEREAGLKVIFGDHERPFIPDSHIVYRLRFTAKTGRFEVPDDEAHLYE
ncbi:MAG: pyridoxamine 5'-phosphate oxidase family protein [Thermomicrobiales bacterium]|nr:pyridoxamine 5'-phosphate oxidase family protein [Thermomicrobiales bacterium]MCO5218381.1 pyridoxamine 5'-phosphate oxidase family protein [Thermomicrobiales bacterium]MCO5224144.1 pyridoxamine 5'-phosphate oxidase family protein [Thermomicrobiales bacterium]MCO5227101.1 pyridoxamine 5'-phosphate oxidase family protein [Thermomicrobiales bacterium]